MQIADLVSNTKELRYILEYFVLRSLAATTSERKATRSLQQLAFEFIALRRKQLNSYILSSQEKTGKELVRASMSQDEELTRSNVYQYIYIINAIWFALFCTIHFQKKRCSPRKHNLNPQVQISIVYGQIRYTNGPNKQRDYVSTFLFAIKGTRVLVLRKCLLKEPTVVWSVIKTNKLEDS